MTFCTHNNKQQTSTFLLALVLLVGSTCTFRGSFAFQKAHQLISLVKTHPIASSLVAGGCLAGVTYATIKYFQKKRRRAEWARLRAEAAAQENQRAKQALAEKQRADAARAEQEAKQEHENQIYTAGARHGSRAEIYETLYDILNPVPADLVKIIAAYDSYPCKGTIQSSFGDELTTARIVAVFPDGRLVTGHGSFLIIWKETQPGVFTKSPGTELPMANLSGSNFKEFTVFSNGTIQTAEASRKHKDKLKRKTFKTYKEFVKHYTKGSLGFLRLSGQTIEALALFPDGKIAVGAKDHIQIWQEERGASGESIAWHRILAFQVTRDVDTLAVLPGASAADDRLAVGSLCSKIKIYNLNTGICEQEFDTGAEEVWTLAVTPYFHGKPYQLVSGDNRCNIIVWDLTTRRPANVLQGSREGTIDITFLPDGRLLSTGNDGTIKIWDIEAGICRATIQASSTAISAVAPLTDGKIVSGDQLGIIKIWEEQSHNNTISWNCVSETQAYSNPVRGIVWKLKSLPDGRFVSTGESWADFKPELGLDYEESYPLPSTLFLWQ